MKLLARITQMASSLPVLLVGSYRDDERAALAAELPGAEALALARLSATDVARLCSSILGGPNVEPSRAPELGKILARASDGNVLLVIELLRALAHEAGGLEHVQALALGEQHLAHRIEGLVRQRVERLSEQDRAFLRSPRSRDASSISILAALHDGSTSSMCGARRRGGGARVGAGPLVVCPRQAPRRADRGAARRAATADPRRLASAILSVTPGHASTSRTTTAPPARPAREKEFAGLAGDQFLRSGAYHEAIPYLRARSTSLPRTAAVPARAPSSDGSARRSSAAAGWSKRARASARRSRRSGDRCRRRVRSSSRLLGRGRARSASRSARRTGPCARRQPSGFEEADPRVHPALASRPSPERRRARAPCHAERAEPLRARPAPRASRTTRRGHGRGDGPVPCIAGRASTSAQRRRSARSSTTRASRPSCSRTRATTKPGSASGRTCREHLERSMTLYEQIGDVRLWEESVSILAYALFFQGRLPRSLELYRSPRALGRGAPGPPDHELGSDQPHQAARPFRSA